MERASPGTRLARLAELIFIPCLHENFSALVGGPARATATVSVSTASIELVDRHRNPRSCTPFGS